MHRTAKYFLITVGLCLTASLWAQNAKDDAAKKKAAKFPGYAVYLGNSNYCDTIMRLPKRVFDSLMKQGLTSRDSSGKPFEFRSFVFTYGERMLYEDSVGNLVVMTDMMIEYCPGNKLTENITQSLFQRTKKGDTAYIDDILLVDEKQMSRKGRPMKIILQ
jgi:hypothetical protein